MFVHGKDLFFSQETLTSFEDGGSDEYQRLLWKWHFLAILLQRWMFVCFGRFCFVAMAFLCRSMCSSSNSKLDFSKWLAVNWVILQERNDWAESWCASSHFWREVLSIRYGDSSANLSMEAWRASPKAICLRQLCSALFWRFTDAAAPWWSGLNIADIYQVFKRQRGET